jgi:hypothetical protein
MAVQGPARLQPGTGIVTGSLKTPDGKPAAGVRVGAVDIDDPSASTMLSVAETDSAGRFRLTNVPAGKYYIVAGRLSDLRYYPSGADRSTATQILVEPARTRAEVNFSVPLASQRPPSRPPSPPQESAYQQIAAESNLERKARLISQFEKTFPQSPRLAEGYLSLMSAYAGRNDALQMVMYGEHAVRVDPSGVRTLMQVSRTYAGLQGQTMQMDKALKHAEKALTLARGKTQGAASYAAELEASAAKNLAWVQQVQAWQQRSLFSLMAPTRR